MPFNGSSSEKIVPTKVTIYDQEGNPVLELGSRSKNCYFFPGMCNIYRYDLDSGEYRPAKKDAYDVRFLVEALTYIDMASGLALISHTT